MPYSGAMTLSDDTRTVRENSFGWMIQRIAGDVDRQMTERLAELDMPLPAFAVMMCVLERGPMMQTDIGKQFGIPAYAISRALDVLERLGYIARRRHTASRRAHSIEVTEAGRAIAPRLHAIVNESNTDYTASLSDDERQVLCGLLTRLLPDTGS